MLYFRLMNISSFPEARVGETHKLCEKLKANSRNCICWVQGLLSLLSWQAKIAHTYCVSQLLQPPMLTVLLLHNGRWHFCLASGKYPTYIIFCTRHPRTYTCIQLHTKLPPIEATCNSCSCEKRPVNVSSWYGARMCAVVSTKCCRTMLFLRLLGCTCIRNTRCVPGQFHFSKYRLQIYFKSIISYLFRLTKVKNF